MPRHLRCVSGAVAGLLLGAAALAHAQSTGADPAAAAASALLPPWLETLVHEGGLPGVLALLGWWARGLAQSGLPVTVSLAEADRTEISRFRAALERRLGADESDEPKPATGAKA